MKWVQAGCYLHGFHLIDGFACCVEHTLKAERRPAVGVVVLYDEVLCLLRVDERCAEGMMARFYIVVILKAILGPTSPSPSRVGAV